MRSALRKRPEGLACTAAAHFPDPDRGRRDGAPAAATTRASRLADGSSR